MAEREELRVVLRTIADTRGAQQTNEALRGVSRQAAAVNQSSMARTFTVSGESALRFASALAGVNIGLSLFTEAGQQIRGVITNASQAFVQSERVARATAAAYGSLAGSFERFAAALSSQTGFGQREILEAALSARTLSANYGLAISQTQQLIRVSADLANVRGIGVAEAFERVQSAIRGEAEASEFLGLTLNDTFIKNNALNGSVRTTFETMTDAQKAQIRYGEVLRQTAGFSGLAAQGAGSLEGAQRKATRAGEEFNRVVGGLIAPSLRDAALAQSEFTAALTRWLEQFAKVPTQAELERRLQAIQNAPPIGPQPVPRPPVAGSPLIGPVPGQSPTEALNKSLQKLGVPTPEDFQKALNLYRQQQARIAAEQRRLQEVNELPRQTRDQSLAEIAFLDQKDAAVRDLINSQRELTALQTESNRLRGEEARATLDVLPARQEIARLEREIAQTVNRRVQLELESRRIAAERAALPATNALEDSERAVQRAQLVIADRRNQSREDVAAARREIRTLERSTLPGQRLAAFDAETPVIAAGRAQRSFDLDTRARQIPLEQRQAEVELANRGREQTVLDIRQSLDRQEQLANVAAANSFDHERRLEEIVRKGIEDGFLRGAKVTIPIQINVTQADGSIVSYEEQVEAVGQAQMPPVIQVSGVRR